MLKKLKPRHMDIIRRMLTGQQDQEICLELGMSESYLSILKNDPTFATKLEDEVAKLQERFIEQRQDAMQMIEEVQCDAVQMAIGAMKTGLVGERVISAKDQLKSIWDILDRGGTRKAEKKIVAHANIADLVVEAYREKHGAGPGTSDSSDPEAEPEDFSGEFPGGSTEEPPFLMLPPSTNMQTTEGGAKLEDAQIEDDTKRRGQRPSQIPTGHLINFEDNIIEAEWEEEDESLAGPDEPLELFCTC
jgi:hypothetical protein